MRSSVSAALLVSLVASACSPETVGRPPPPPVNWPSLEARTAPPHAKNLTPTEKERAASAAYWKALTASDLADLGKLLDDDVHFAFAGLKDVHGRDNVTKMHDAVLGAYDARRFIASRALLTPSSQVLEWTMTGTHKATQRQVSLKGVALLWTKDDGSIADVHLYYDEALANAQAGVGPKALLALAPPQPPAGPPEEVEQARSATEGTNVAVYRAALEALENEDEPGYVATMSDDIELTTLEGPEPARGKLEARAYFRAMHKAIGHLDTSITNAWGIGPYAVVEYQVVGEQRGPLAWIPAQKDNLLKLFVVDIAEVKDGKIVRVWRYDNPVQILSLPREIQ